MNQCADKSCQNEGTEYRDYTVTGIGDFQYFCKDCVVKADNRRTIQFAKSEVKYAESVLRQAMADVDKSREELYSAKERLERLLHQNLTGE